ncbi:MAG: nucleotide exchange factor GrpE [Candidatus Peribacteria bacterium]|jgi:molecular chaperone GrpE|nr:nucleotide exchange factor GrpE [Candidatus Peribacteria bacterium]
MTKHQTSSDMHIEKTSVTNNDADLQTILQELEIEKAAHNPKGDNQSSSQSSTAETSALALIKLQAQLREKEEIAKKAQIDYITLKADFDFLLRQTKMKEETLEQDTLIKVVKNFLPFVEDVRKSLLHLTEEQKKEPLGKGVQMVYDKFISALAELQIFPINTLYVEPDTQLHEPISVQPTEDKKLKGKVLQIFEQGFYYQKGTECSVIFPSKVIIGA